MKLTPSNRRLFITHTAALCAAPALAQSTPGTWRIGRVLPLTGAQASYGEAKRDGGDVFAASINQRGGLSGRKLELITLDDAYVEARTLDNVLALHEKSRPIAYTGFFGAPHCVAAAKGLDQIKVPGVGFTTGSNAFRTKPQREVFPVRASFAQETAAIVRHLKTTGLKDAVIAFVNIPFGQLAKSSFEAAAREQDLKLATPVEIKADISNLAEATAALRSAGTVLLALHTPSAIAMVQSLRRVSPAQQLWCLSAVDTAIMASKLQAAVRGVSTSLVVPPATRQASIIVREYASACTAAQRPLTSYGLEAYIEMKVLAAGLARMRGGDPNALVNALESINKLDLGGFEVEYGSGNRTGSRYVDVAMVTEQRVVS